MSNPFDRRRGALALAGVGALSLALLWPVAGASASDPANSGSLSPSPNPGAVTAAWSGTVAGVNSDSDCDASLDDSLNDHHTFTVSVPANFYDTHEVTMQVTTVSDTADTILTVRQDGTSLGASDNGSVGGAETYTASNPSGAYDAITCAFAAGGDYQASVTLTTALIEGAGGDTRTGGTSDTAGTSSYTNYPLFGEGANPSIPGADESGEPSIGVDWNTGNVFFQANLHTIKAVFPESGAPALTDVSCVLQTANTLDPILFTDPTTGLTGVSQLLALPAVLNSETMFFKGNPTAQQPACTPSNGGPPAAGPDHQTLGGGAYPKPLPATATAALSGRALYYCSQAIVAALCGRSDNDGVAFNNTGSPPYTVQECGGLHGHIRVGPEGNAYLPNKSCGGKQGFAATTDAGETWTVQTVPGSTAGATDPSVAADKAGTVFFGYVDGDGKPKVVTSPDAGESFGTPVSIGEAFGIQSATWAEVIAGDAGRAAMAFLGTTLPGDRNDNDFGKTADGTEYVKDAVFHAYIATTVDGGASWNTVDVTPIDPVQRGAICTNGTTCMGGTRNLLDFNDIVVDKKGRVLFGYADGCTEACVTSTKVSDNAHSAYGTIARQTGGPLLFVPDSGTNAGTDVPEAPLILALPIIALLGGGALLLAQARRSERPQRV